jgi:hypothetical protein
MNVLQAISFVIYLIAAGLWYVSSRLKVPPYRDDMGYSGPSKSLAEMHEALSQQSRLSAGAAFATFVATLLQALSTVFPASI